MDNITTSGPANSNVTSINTNQVVKTVYDPSPAGFCLPSGLTGFTTTGNVTSTVTDFNVSGAWDNGWHFYCNTDGTGETIYFPLRALATTRWVPPFAVGNYYCWSAGSGSIMVLVVACTAIRRASTRRPTPSTAATASPSAP